MPTVSDFLPQDELQREAVMDHLTCNEVSGQDLDPDKLLSDNPEINPILTLFRPVSDVRLGYTLI